MNKYIITNYSKSQAKKLGVNIRPSSNPSKKIDVYKNDKKLASIGASDYMDYPTYIKERGLTYAKSRRKLYKKRHEKDRKVPNTPGYFADKILW